jgi:RNA polymerase primary sigma factor
VATERRGGYRSDDRSIDLYLKELTRYPLLNRERERELAQRIQKGDEEALQEMVNSNLRFVVSIAKTYANQGLDLADLINEGNMGLITAARRFDHTRGYKFITYAVWWIRQAMIKALAEQSRITRLPLNRAGAIYKVNQAVKELSQKLGRQPRAQEIAKKLNMSESDVTEALHIANSYLSLDECYNEDEDNALIEYFLVENDIATDGEAVKSSLRANLTQALDNLTDREQHILTRYFGLDGREAETLEQIGRRMGLTRERIRQLKERAIFKLRQSKRSRHLEDFIH